MLQERANGSATSKPYNWSYPRHMKKKPNKTRLRNNIKLSKVITMCTPGRKRHQNGPMIYVHSGALQLASCSFLQAPVQCARQVRNDTKMDQWSTFVPRTSVDLMQFFGSARTTWSPSQKRYQNGPMICVWSHALHVPVHSSHLEFIAETNVCAYTKIICIWKFLKRFCEIFKTVKPEEVSFVVSTKSTQSLRPILSCYLCFPPAFLHFYFLPLLGKCFSSHNPSKFRQIAMLDWAWWRLCLTEWREWRVTCQQPIDNISHLCCYGFPLEIFVTHTQGTSLSLTVAVYRVLVAD